MSVKFDKILGRVRERDTGSNATVSLPEGFSTWQDYFAYQINNTIQLPEQFNTWQEFTEWMTVNNFHVPEGFSSFEQYIQYLSNQSFPLPDQFNTWQEFTEWMTVNNYMPPAQFNTWEEYLTYQINNAIPLPDQFNTWEEFNNWLTINNFSIPEGFTSLEEYTQYLIDQSFPLPDQFNTWQEFTEWMTVNNFNPPEGFTSYEEYNQYLIQQNFPLPEQFNTWQEFTEWLMTNNSFPNEYNTWEEYIQSIVNQTIGEDTGTYLISGTITHKAGLTYHATDLVYKILGHTYTAPGRDITLLEADPIKPRIDIFIADRFGNISAIPGEPSDNPIKPTVNYDDLEITQANLPAGAIVPVNIITELIYDEGTPGEWQTVISSDNNISVISNNSAAPNSGLNQIRVSIAIPDAIGNKGTRYIGERYQGGIIFYLYPGGQKGLIAAPSDQCVGAKYEAIKNASPYSTNANGLIIGTGKANSLKLAAHLHNAALHAIKYCKNYLGGGYNDWFLPSRDELTAMYFRRSLIGGFSPVDYWSSSEIDWNEAYSVRFSDGYVTDRDKDHSFRIRAIREFDDSQQTLLVPVTEYSPVNTKIEFVAPEIKPIKNGILVFSLRSSLSWLNTSGLLIESMNGTTKTGGIMLKSLNTYGYDSNKNLYQQVAIPLKDFSSSNADITSFTFRLANTWKNLTILDIDSVKLQYDEAQQLVTKDKLIETTKRDANGRSIDLTGTIIDMSLGEIFKKTLSEDTTLTVVNPILAKEILLIIDGNYRLTLPGLQMGASLDYNGLSKNYITLKCTSLNPEPQFMIWDIDREKTEVMKDEVTINFADTSLFGFRIYTSNYNDIFLDWLNTGFKAKTGGGEITKTSSNVLGSVLVSSDIGSISYLSDLGTTSQSRIIGLNIMAPKLQEVSLTNNNYSILTTFQGSSVVFDLSSFPELEKWYAPIGSVFQTVNLSGCKKLKQFYSGPSYGNVNGYTNVILQPSVPESVDYSFNSNVLPEANVNYILIHADTVWNTPSGIKKLTIKGAAPTGDGITAKNNLIAKGWTITTT